MNSTHNLIPFQSIGAGPETQTRGLPRRCPFRTWNGKCSCLGRADGLRHGLGPLFCGWFGDIATRLRGLLDINTHFFGEGDQLESIACAFGHISGFPAGNLGLGHARAACYLGLRQRTGLGAKALDDFGYFTHASMLFDIA